MKIARTLGRRDGTDALGFTLIELLAVLAILSILLFFLATKLGGVEEASRESLTRAYLKEIEIALTDYETEFGDYPASSLPEAERASANSLNAGGEALVVGLWKQGWDGGGLAEDKLVNTDGDSSKTKLTTFGVRDLFELSDLWENPIAYFHHRDYGQAGVYVTVSGDTGEEIQGPVQSVQNKKTGRPFNPHTVQLLSAGVDGRFGTEDDIGNFDR